jgi:hypothetical protein
MAVVLIAPKTHLRQAQVYPVVPIVRRQRLFPHLARQRKVLVETVLLDSVGTEPPVLTVLLDSGRLWRQQNAPCALKIIAPARPGANVPKPNAK